MSDKYCVDIKMYFCCVITYENSHTVLELGDSNLCLKPCVYIEIILSETIFIVHVHTEISVY